jgi:hypothetical protein
MDGGIDLEGMALYGPRRRIGHDLAPIMVIGTMVPVNYPSSRQGI